MPTETAGFFSKLRDRLTKTRGQVAGGMKRVFAGRTRIDEEVFNDLEETLIQADFGVDTTLAIVEDLRKRAKEHRIQTPEELISALKDDLTAILEQGDHRPTWENFEGTHITLITGVNGSGKTTTAGKLAARLAGEGNSVILGAADTFRAAAVEQLSIWSDRVGVPIIKHKEGADPAAVAYDTTDAALSRNVDRVLIDTAGRLHTKVNLMEELKKVRRVVEKRLPGAPHETLLVLDATTGQNALQQAKVFTETLNVTGIVLTKLDGTAKGGVAVAIQKELGLPIKFIGVGESVDDLQPFDPRAFVEALFEVD